MKAPTTEELTTEIDVLVWLLEECHQDEIEHRHYGDPKSDCSYCQAIKKARKLLKRAAA